MGDDDVTNCCHGDLVFEITSNGEAKGACKTADEKIREERKEGDGKAEGKKRAVKFCVGTVNGKR